MGWVHHESFPYTKSGRLWAVGYDSPCPGHGTSGGDLSGFCCSPPDKCAISTDREGDHPLPPLPLLCLRGGVGDAGLSAICEDVASFQGRVDGLSTPNNAMMQGLLYCQCIFEGREYFSASLPLLGFSKNVFLLNYSLDLVLELPIPR